MIRKMENVADIYPLTPTQQGMLFHVLREPDSEVYFEQVRCTLAGPLDVANFQAAWQIVVDHHPALRTIFLWEGLAEPLQVVRQEVTVPWDIQDWRAAQAGAETRLEELAAAYRRDRFDLAQAPLLKMGLIRLDDQTHHFIWNFNHLMLDGWSAYQVFDEVLAVYEVLIRGEQPALPPARPFRNYVAWLKKQDMEAAESIWRQQLAGFDTPTPLNIDQPTTQTAVSFAEAMLELPASLTKALQSFAQGQRVTLNTVLQAAWALLLSRYSGEDDVLFGSTLSGRPAALPGVEKMVGMFINTLPLRVRISGEQTLLPWLRQLQSDLLQLRQVEYSPLVKVQRWSDVPAGQPLFDSLIVFENYPVTAADPQRTIEVHDKHYREQSNYPLALLVVPREQLRLRAIYDRQRFEPAAIERLLGHLENILAAMVANPAQTLDEISLLSPSERQQLLIAWNDTERPIAPQQCLPEFVTQHAQRTPDATAVITADTRLTYAELNARANQIAQRLLREGITPGTPVGLYMERSAAMIAGIIGILKAGGAYVPLDPTYPARRIAYILQDLDISVIVAGETIAAQLPAHDTALIPLDPTLATLAAEEADDPQVPVTLDDLAYIIYTSGSTGTPKGVMVSHRNLLNSTMARCHYYEEPVGRFLLLSSFAFDSSVAGIFWTLLGGGALVLPAPDEDKDVQRLAAIIDQERVTHTLALPALYRLLLTYAPARSLDSLRVVIVAGEACPPDLGGTHYRLLPQATLYNEYGPTEATVWSSVYKLPRTEDRGPVPIGRPIPNSRLYILDRRRQPVPIDVPGELYIGGANVTAGYWNNPALTAERFPTLEFADYAPIGVPIGVPIGRVYRTGDVARWRADGQVEFLGRVDNQVNIRGFRIEPGEIEALLLRHPAVEEAAVVVHRQQQTDALVAYVSGADLNGDSRAATALLQTYLAETLPEPMVPRQYLVLPALPRTPNGKVDRRRLPRPALEANGGDRYAAPRTATEEALAQIWAEVLHVPQVGVEDNFFDLGGDSINAIQLFSLIAQRMDRSLPFNLLFLSPTVAQMAAAIDGDEDEHAPDPVLLPIKEDGSRPPFFYAHGIFGDVSSLTNIIPLLDDEQPIYGLQAFGLDPAREPDQTMEQMAARYVDAMRRIQPAGPYHLGGFCFGGVMAYEIARQLAESGEKVALLAIFEGSAPRRFHRSRPLYDPQRLQVFAESAPHLLRGYQEFGGWRIGDRIRARFNHRSGRGSGANNRKSINVEFDNQADFNAARPEIQHQLREIHSRAIQAYEPKPFNGRVTLFRARYLHIAHSLLGQIDPERGWGALAQGGVTIHYVDGTHVGILQPPYAPALAEALAQALANS